MRIWTAVCMPWVVRRPAADPDAVRRGGMRRPMEAAAARSCSSIAPPVCTRGRRVVLGVKFPPAGSK
jgi:hypothetical protein